MKYVGTCGNLQALNSNWPCLQWANCAGVGTSLVLSGTLIVLEPRLLPAFLAAARVALGVVVPVKRARWRLAWLTTPIASNPRPRGLIDGRGLDAASVGASRRSVAHAAACLSCLGRPAAECVPSGASRSTTYTTKLPFSVECWLNRA